MSGQPSKAYPHTDNTDEIDLRELWRVMVKSKRMILSVTFLAALLAAAISLMLPNIYRAEVLLAPVVGDDGNRGGLPVALGGLGGLGGLASLAGLSLGVDAGSVEENIAVLKSREFLWKFVQEQKLMPILFEDDWDSVRRKWKENDSNEQPGQLDVYRLFNTDGVLEVSVDKKSNLVTVAVEWEDPEMAAAWANQLVANLSQYLRLKAIERSENNLKYLNEELNRIQHEELRKTLFDLIGGEQKNAMIANAQREFAFHVIDPAVAPDKKIKPKRAIIVLLVALLTGLIATFVALMANQRKSGMSI